MTTTTTKGTPSPQTWNIILAVAALGFVAFLAWSQGFGSTSVTGQQQAEESTATLPESVTGFEYNNEATAGRSVAPGITGDYFGYSGELYPEASATVEPRSFFDEHVATGRVSAPPVLDQATFDRIAELTWTFELEPEVSAEPAPAVRSVAAFAGADLATGQSVASVPAVAVAPPTPVIPQETLDAIGLLQWTFLDGPAASTGTESATRPLAAFASTDLATDQAVASVPSVATPVPALPDSVTGFEYNNESTAARFVGEGVTSSYFGYNPNFDPDE